MQRGGNAYLEEPVDTRYTLIKALPATSGLGLSNAVLDTYRPLPEDNTSTRAGHMVSKLGEPNQQTPPVNSWVEFSAAVLLDPR